ncbi:hypothetical protein [Geminisphaera colitermitum]|uniref:hypothetical protein n=1 Tax=Geminisphaera colitermitum TaxID=1148786 RepID=UPI000158C780|nr:hypothetical protein [Geminisphaera colitermitum]
MAKATKTSTLSFRDIVLGAEADIIRQALEARVQIDQLLEERLRAYERIAALETQVEDVLGEPGGFPFPAPPLPVAGFDPRAETVLRGAAGAAGSGRKGPGRRAASVAGDDADAGTDAATDATDDTDTANDADDKS